MREIPLYMLHHLHLDVIPNTNLPEGYQFRMFSSEEDINHWTAITTATGEFSSESEARERFSTEFQPYLSEVKKRMFFIETADGKVVGTATAWFGTWEGHDIGRLHWIEILPEYQGKKLGKPLVAEAMRLLAMYHEKAYLKTQPSSQAAIHIYKKFGWKPGITSEQDERIWTQL